MKTFVPLMTVVISLSSFASLAEIAPNQAAVKCHFLRDQLSKINADGSVGPICNSELIDQRTALYTWQRIANPVNHQTLIQAIANSNACADQFEKVCVATFSH